MRNYHITYKLNKMWRLKPTITCHYILKKQIINFN